MRVHATRTVTAEASGDAGDDVLLHVVATCDRSTVSAERRLSLATESCFGGPIHVYAAQGTSGVDDSSRTHALLAGDLLRAETPIRIDRGGHALLGATECNNFRVALGPGRYLAGSYDAGGKGDGFYGRNALVVGDEHSGGFAIAHKAVVEPIGRACARCAPPPVSFEGRTQSPRRATIRVFRGGVRVVTGERLARAERALAGQQIDVLCHRECTLTHPRLWQPNEPWTTPPQGLAQAFPHVIRSARPSAEALAPPRAHILVREMPAAGGGAPEQLAVIWEREVRTEPGRYAGNLQTEQGLVVWQRTATRVWRRVLSRPYPVADSPPSLTTGDVTGDHHPDLLVTLEQGSGACGPREIFATVHARIRRIFDRNECESFVRLKGGAVQLDEPVGRRPFTEGSAHCFGGEAHIVERWNGRRLVVGSRRVRCTLPRLDPAADCNRRKRP